MSPGRRPPRPPAGIRNTSGGGSCSRDWDGSWPGGPAWWWSAGCCWWRSASRPRPGCSTGEGVFDRLSNGAPQVPGESKDGLELLTRTAPAGNTVFLLLDGVDPADPALRQAVTAAARDDLTAPDGVLAVGDPYAAENPGPSPYVSADGRAVLVSGGPASTTCRTPPRSRTGRRPARPGDGRPGRRPGELIGGGIHSSSTRSPARSSEDLSRGEAIALPVSLLVMVVVFGGLARGRDAACSARWPRSPAALASLLGFSYLIDLDASVRQRRHGARAWACASTTACSWSAATARSCAALGIGPHDGRARVDADVVARPGGDDRPGRAHGAVQRGHRGDQPERAAALRGRILRAVGAAGVSVVAGRRCWWR